MATFYDDPYCWIDDACESIERGDQGRARNEFLAAIAISLLSIAEGRGNDTDDSVPAAPIMYENFNAE